MINALSQVSSCLYNLNSMAVIALPKREIVSQNIKSNRPGSGIRTVFFKFMPVTAMLSECIS